MFHSPVQVLVKSSLGNLKITSIFRSPVFLNRKRTYQQENYDGLNIWDEDLNQSTKFKIEKYWKDKMTYPEFDSNKGESKFYILSMFPYPSGNLHMGHIRVYSMSDTLARFYRMTGKNVLHPMGWDAFGLPAENAAIERGLSSETWTADNIATMRTQLKQLGCTFDWSRELATCQPDYYKFTQAIFLQLYEHGLVYQKKALVNWDPVDKTVLADEQVDEQGRSWRSGAKVEKKILKQWFVKTTAFAKALYDGLNRKDLEDWKDIIDLQKEWIGVCDGVTFDFPLKNQDGHVTLWTDKPEHLSKAAFVAVLPGSVLDRECEGSGERKLDVQVTNTLTNTLLPVYVTDRVPFYQASEARIGLPNVYKCDSDFAKSVGLPLNKNNENITSERQTVIDTIKGSVSSSNLRDWLISRQRHWGTPIPVVHCEKCGPQPVPYDKLPVELPQLKSVTSRELRVVPDEWTSTVCPKCGGAASRDQDTMDTFVDSSWYYLRYLDPTNQAEPVSKTVAAKLMPVDIYIGGKEHAVLHLYYARFVSYFLHTLGWLQDPEPFQRLLVQGMILGKTYRVKDSGKYLPASQVDLSGEKAVEKGTGELVTVSWDKMSKSKHNGVDPEQMLRDYGIDTTRLIIMSSVAPTSPRNWDDSLFPGVLNWQRKLWMAVQEFRAARLAADTLQVPSDLHEVEEKIRYSRNSNLRAISVSYCATHQFNAVVARMQGLTGDLRRYGAEYKAHSVEYGRSLAMVVVTLSPIAPHFAAQLWSGLRSMQSTEFDMSKPVHLQSWPEIDPDHPLGLTCMVNSAIKEILKMNRADLDQLTTSSATQLALSRPQVREYTDQTPVLDAYLKVYPGLHATLNLTLDHTKLNFNKEHYQKKTKVKRKVFK